MSDYPSMSHVQHITFEGNDCVVMSPEEYGAALADLEAKDYELSALRAELTEARRQLAAQPAVPEAVVKDVERLDWLVSECAVVQSLAISPPHGDGTTRYYICWPEYGEEQIDTYATAREAIDAAILSATDSEGRSNG